MDLTEIVTDAIIDRRHLVGQSPVPDLGHSIRWRTSGAECDHGECTWVCGDGTHVVRNSVMTVTISMEMAVRQPVASKRDFAATAEAFVPQLSAEMAFE